MTGHALIPGSYPGRDAHRNGLPESRYTHWNGRPLPVVPVADRPDLPERCGKCDKFVNSKIHRRLCLGQDIKL